MPFVVMELFGEPGSRPLFAALTQRE